MIRNHLAQLTRHAILAAQAAGDLPAFELPDAAMGRPQKPEWGDYASSVALKLASVARRAPLQIAQTIVKHLPADPALARAQAAPPGFINFTLAPQWLAEQVARIEQAGTALTGSLAFGNLNLGAGQRVQVEHVSANPTGPLTVGSARNGALGDTLARILRAAGYTVETEYYINDAGSQIQHFGASIYARYAQLLGRDEPFPEDGYKGAYVSEIAQEILDNEGARYLERPREEALRALGRIGIDQMIASARETLARMRVEFDSWFSEKSLYDGGLFDRVIAVLRQKGLTFEKEGAEWFAATQFGLDKDAVLIRSPKVIPAARERPTYLASDVAYVWDKLVERKFDRAIYVWGSDHQGDVPRVLAVTRALGLDAKRVTILLYQHVLLKRGGEMVRMSKRAGEFVTLRQVIDEVGADAVRFMLITRSADSTMDFDLQSAKEQTEENPVYYVQYAHARIASILRHAAELGATSEGGEGVGHPGGAADAGASPSGMFHVGYLQHPAELELIRQMLRLEEVIEVAAVRLEPHHLTHYAMELAATFHAFYRQCRVVSSDPADAEISKARLKLVRAARAVLARTLDLMGVSAPEMM